MVDTRAVDDALAEARAALGAPAAARARVRARLEAGGAFAGGLGAVAPGGASATRLTSAFGVARSTVALLVGLGFGAGYWLGMHHPQAEAGRAEAGRAEPSHAAPPHGEASAAAEPALAVPGEVLLVPPSQPPTLAPAGDTREADPQATRATQAPPRRAHRNPAPRAVPHEGFGDEVALLQRTERALRAGEPELALSFVRELERRYPESPFGEERRAARVMAECALQRAGALERAASFLRDRPASVYSDRVRQLCVPVGADGSHQPGN
jgi:hypothetical protein